MSLKSFQNELKIVKNNLFLDSLFISRENIMQLTGIETPRDVIKAFNRDLKKSIDLIKALVTAIENPQELKNEGLSPDDILLYKNGNLNRFLGRDISSDSIRAILLESYFGNDDIQIIDYGMKFKTSALDKLYDTTQPEQFLFYTTDRLNANDFSDKVLEVNNKSVKLLKDSDKLKDYDSVYNSKIATVYTEKLDSLVLDRNEDGIFEAKQNKKNLKLSDDFLTEINKCEYMHSLEIDEATDMNKMLKFVKLINELNFNLKDSFYLKIRLLGKHRQAGLYFDPLSIIALDMNYEFSFIHELTHHIDLTTGIENRDKLISYFSQFMDLENESPDKLSYYTNPKEIIARAGEVAYCLHTADFKNLYSAYRKNKPYKDYGAVTDDNFQDILMKTSKHSMIGTSFRNLSHPSNAGVYYDLKNRNMDELATMYKYFENVFHYPEKIHQKEINTDNALSNRLHLERKIFNNQFYKNKSKTSSYAEYSFKKIEEVLTHFNNDDIGLMTKENFLVSFFVHPTTSSSFKEKLLDMMLDDDNNLINEVEGANVVRSLIEFIDEKGLNKFTFRLAIIIKDFLPPEYQSKFNILTIGNMHEINNETIPDFYKKYKEGMLHISQPSIEENFNSKTLLTFFDKLKSIKDFSINLEEGATVPYSNDFVIDEYGNIEVKDSYVETELNIDTYSYDADDNLYLIDDDKTYKIPEHSTEKKYMNDLKYMNNYFDERGVDFEELPHNGFILDGEEAKSLAKEKYYSNTAKSDFYKMAFYKKGTMWLGFSISYEELPHSERKGNDLIFSDGTKIEIAQTVNYPKGNSVTSTANPDSYSLNNGVLEKGYSNPITSFKKGELLSTDNMDMIIEHTNYDELLQVLEKISYISEHKSILIASSLFDKVIAKYGIEKIDKILEFIYVNGMFKNEYIDYAIKSNDKANLFKSLTIDTSYNSKLRGGDNIIPSIGYLVDENIDLIIDSLSTTFKSLISSYKLIVENQKEKILNKFLFNESELEELNASFEDFEKITYKGILTFFYEMYNKSILNVDNNIIAFIDKFWENAYGKDAIKSKFESNLISKELEVELDSIESFKLSNSVETVIKAFAKSKAKKGKNDLLNMIKASLSTNIHNDIDIGNKNIFDYCDMNPRFNRSSKEALKEAEKKVLFKTLSLEQSIYLENKLDFFNHSPYHDNSKNYSHYEEGFVLLRQSLGEMNIRHDISTKKLFQNEKSTEPLLSYSPFSSDDIIKNAEEDVTIEITSDEIEHLHLVIKNGFDKFLKTIEVEKINTSSKLHKRKLFESIDNFIETFDFNGMNIIEFIETNYETRNISSLQSLMSRTKSQLESEFRTDKNKYVYANLLFITKFDNLLTSSFKKKDKDNNVKKGNFISK